EIRSREEILQAREDSLCRLADIFIGRVNKRALEEYKGVKYTRCNGKSKLHLKVCHQDVTARYGHLIMTHPNNPKQQVIMICVDKQALSSLRKSR
ncbi:MAG: hypothetical protein N0E42_14875, partial [Candidatus Thiodiazotropha endolucinida]|nr:hypothetical protein [Candidatus Thiodiazotropha taylori]MCW4225754.1 hypothetical protein [Candidatus Thiodiazotropha endolucinida]